MTATSAAFTSSDGELKMSATMVTLVLTTFTFVSGIKPTVTATPAASSCDSESATNDSKCHNLYLSPLQWWVGLVKQSCGSSFWCWSVDFDLTIKPMLSYIQVVHALRISLPIT